MQMISNYETIKTNLSKNDPKGFEEITLEFKSCNNIEMQKKICVLLLKNVKKNALLKFKVLDEFNSLLMKINNKHMKDGIYELLYEMHSKIKDNTDTKSLKENIQATTWNFLKFEDKEVKIHKGYAFIDSTNVAFYSSIENFVISYESIESFERKENTVTFNLKNGKQFIITLFGDQDLFTKRLNLEFKMTSIFKNITEVYRSPNTSIIIKKENVPSDVINEKSTQIPTRRSSLSEAKLLFNSDNTKSFGKNLKIKITPPKKVIFSENQADYDANMPKKILIKENEDDQINNKSQKESYQSTSELSNNLIEDSRFTQDLNEFEIHETTFDPENPLVDKNDNQNKKRLRNNKVLAKRKTVKKSSNKLKNKNYQIKITKKISKFVKTLTKKRTKNLNSLFKLQAKNIKQRGEALKNVLLTFIIKYMRIIKLN
ncbi:hypothetical protein NBO_4g0010 [Nosema bombycis CQ1]|uniref:Uncharacterized protein n=1 Tax=Nosema bombycis (strain CQ1 / CVCC 102059) TaxID=578461 RepID=R0KYY2_NOSB1|nr:hypothetical protein NBO_4g0010 [Nosema bombycis CQ1]|eukprot:EOB15382.1 hypothetical protein NBO_4g0010 [Nosema bombycis CQ1]